eukprot:3926379-Lingulodinium_polyedra.AAC.1
MPFSANSTLRHTCFARVAFDVNCASCFMHARASLAQVAYHCSFRCGCQPPRFFNDQQLHSNARVVRSQAL